MVTISYLKSSVIKQDMEDIISRQVPWKDFDGTNVLITGAGGMLGAYMVRFAGYVESGFPCKIVRIFHTYAPSMDIQKDKRVFSEFVTIGRSAERILSIVPEKGLHVVMQNGEANDAYLENQDAGSAPPDITKIKQLGASFHVGIKEGFQRVITFFQEQKI